QLKDENSEHRRIKGHFYFYQYDHKASLSSPRRYRKTREALMDMVEQLTSHQNQQMKFPEIIK
ncbi:hypothetical protein NO135_25435, partial [Clostridioides difficile]|nr:hypothetical protein [Clostridioides difficile]